MVPTEAIRSGISRNHRSVLGLLRDFHAWLHSILPGLDGAIRVALLAGLVRGTDGREYDLPVRLLQYDVSRDALVRIRSFRSAGLERLGGYSVAGYGHY